MPIGVCMLYTCGRLTADYISHVERVARRPDGTPTRSVANVELALRLMATRYAALPAESLDSAIIKAMRATWVREGLCRRTIIDRQGVVTRAMAWAAQMGEVTDDAAARVAAVPPLSRGMAPDGAGVAPAPLADVLATIPHLPEHVREMAAYILHTGCRVGEAREARSADIYEAGSGQLVHRPIWHKTARHRVVREILLDSEAAEIVRARMDRPYIFGPDDGSRPYHQASLVAPYARACRRAGVPTWTPGQLRHTTAQLVMREAGMEACRAMLGHTTDRLVRRYAGEHIGPAARTAVRAIETSLPRVAAHAYQRTERTESSHDRGSKYDHGRGRLCPGRI